PVRRSLHIDLEPLAVFTAEERVRLRVAEDFALDWIPVDLAAQTHGDVREVTNLEHAVVGPDVGNGLLPRSHAFDEISGVVGADLAAINLLDGVLRQRAVFQVFHRFAGELAAIDIEPAFGALEQNAVVAFAGNDQLDAVGHIDANGELRR